MTDHHATMQPVQRPCVVCQRIMHGLAERRSISQC